MSLFETHQASVSALSVSYSGPPLADRSAPSVISVLFSPLEAILPVTQIRVVALELVADCLLKSQDTIDIDSALDLAGQLWNQDTADELVPAILEVLPREQGLQLVAIISVRFPLLCVALEQQLAKTLISLISDKP